ncbi:mechanosensitive ion channel family protein [Tepidibacter hydrothermalis]|uniref:Mechanosensitive ion channel n=1 Tax=Tepidibacter hydrothermalis TaxID=3036126 RepID=A0ABY8EI38_9FIRM|nr:mechanosensitive ion channel domain-containing protein [Tepidibacter hydrothermalis]WFD11474.1 mechanosensitive ion channel [Tepidibacter hydrothermalis]
MNSILTYINGNDLVIKVFWTIIAFIAIMLSIKIINHIIYNNIDDNNKYYLVRKRVYYFFSSIFVVVCIFLWSNSGTSLTTYLGLVSAGIAIALKNLFSNIAAWVFIIIKKPFKVSDRISINNQKGDVIDIRMFQFSLMEVSSFENGEQSTGRIAIIPNHYIFSHSLINYNKGFKYIWSEIKVLITFESDWEKAKTILTDVSNKHSLHLSDEASRSVDEAKKNYMIHYNNLTPIVYTDVKESGIQLTMRYLCPPRQMRNTVNDIWEDILRIFRDEEDIQLAYPTTRVTRD